MVIRVIIADDQILFRKGLVSLVNGFEGIEVIAEANDGQELLDALKVQVADVVLLDIKMPHVDGLEAAVLLRDKYPELKIVVLTMHDEEKFISHMVKMGVNSYLMKDAEPEEVELSIRTVMSKGFHFNEAVSRIIHRSYLKKHSPKPKVNKTVHFTQREVEIIKLICEEKTNNEIALLLNLSHRTIANHRQKILEKAGVKNTVGIVLFAIRNGFFIG